MTYVCPPESTDIAMIDPRRLNLASRDLEFHRKIPSIRQCWCWIIFLLVISEVSFSPAFRFERSQLERV
ncbi:hypothetical protein F2Q68_00026687 [Brassica cretica]|uniref:Uncharacterized protein n=1 Tax=Brassica cretica TaxID=69181 RepID=A0A8S9IEI3_BRACR|nr:hypothetical protein F2Q68_00026687 [Brassica cretica]